MTIEKRLHPRIAMSETASVTTQGKTLQATLVNLSCGGAFLTSAQGLPSGSGVRISFRLSTGLPVTLNGRVVRALADSGGAGVGVQFFEVDDVTREILDDYLKSSGATAANTIDAEVSVKYRLAARHGRIDLTLSGYLERGDCVRLRELVESELAAYTGRQLLLVIDATQFVCCAPDGLKEFRAWLDILRLNHVVIGGIIGQRTVGVLQLRRVVREAQIADAFMGFESAAEADEILGQLSA